MENKEQIKKEIKKWIDDNREYLPLNIDYWGIEISEIKSNIVLPKMLTFGKYNASNITTASFYKPQSRIVKL